MQEPRHLGEAASPSPMLTCWHCLSQALAFSSETGPPDARKQAGRPVLVFSRHPAVQEQYLVYIWTLRTSSGSHRMPIMAHADSCDWSLDGKQHPAFPGMAGRSSATPCNSLANALAGRRKRLCPRYLHRWPWPLLEHPLKQGRQLALLSLRPVLQALLHRLQVLQSHTGHPSRGATVMLQCPQQPWQPISYKIHQLSAAMLTDVGIGSLAALPDWLTSFDCQL